MVVGHGHSSPRLQGVATNAMSFIRPSLRYARAHGARSILLLLAVTTGLLPATALGRVVTCRTDPLVLLSDNTVVQMTATISTHGHNLRRITYVLHAPAGTTVERITYTGDRRISQLEEVILLADTLAEHYATETVVTAASPHVAVTARTLIGKHAASVTGESDTPLVVSLHIPESRSTGRKP
jgi:hypothetical protein